MTLKIVGVVHGHRIDLARDPGLPDGTEVTVEIEAQSPPLPIEVRNKLLADLRGIWADQDDILDIFEQIDRDRHQSKPRTIDFDAPA